MLTAKLGWIRDHHTILNAFHRLMDALIILSTFFLTFKYLQISLEPISISLPLVAIGLYYLIATKFGLYLSWRTGSIVAEIKKVAWAWTLVILLSLACQLIINMPFSEYRKIMLIWFISGLLVLTGWRLCLRLLLHYFRKKGRNKKFVAIVGGGELGWRIADSIKHNPWTGLEIIGMFENCEQDLEQSNCNNYTDVISGSLVDLIALAEKGSIDYVYIALTVKDELLIHKITDGLSATKVELYIAPDLLMLDFLDANNINFDESLNINIIINPLHNTTYWIKRPQHVVKRFFDIAISIFILSILSPLLILISLLFLILEGAPITYRSIRYISLNKKIYTYKFRSMVRNATDPKHRLKERFMRDGFLDIPLDCEVYTPIGRFLEKTQLVEILQLINILFDHMSFIGNRPLPFDNLCLLKKIPGWDKRFESPAGLTGITQVIGKLNLTPQKRLELEGLYSDVYASGNILKCDLLIMLYTARLLLFKKDTPVEEAMIMMNSCLPPDSVTNTPVGN
jgi:putative colanic acid biosynthesis UDP-glucose lipid carrier transferase